MVKLEEVSEELPVNEELFVQLRSRFLDDLNKKGNYDEYEEADIERMRKDDVYCKRFILHKKQNLENALEMVHEALKWRKSFGVKDVTQESIPIEFFQAKAVFPYNHDKENNPIILLLCRYHKKAPQFAKDLRRFVIYWVELMEAQTNGGQMTVIMSCTGAGLSNLDLDLIKFLITLFRSYYPHSLAYILIYEMPWIFNAAWKIIKAWLPEDFVEKIRFVNITSIQDYINEDCLPVEMGGTDTKEYEPPSVVNDINSNTIQGNEPKRVASNERKMQRSPSKDESARVLITDDYCIIGGMLKICPAINLVFNPPLTSDSNDAVIKFTCVSETAITYKVKTNNIESYRVKPSIGIIEPGNSIDINVKLLPGFHPQPTDKFLIMAMEVPDVASAVRNLPNLWKTSPSGIIADHKLKCSTKKIEEVVETEMEKTLKSITSTLSNMETKMQSLDSVQSSLLFKQTISLYLLVGLSFLFLAHVIFSDGASVISALSGLF